MEKAIDLIEKYKQSRVMTDIENFLHKKNYLSEYGRFKTGQIIEFWAGMYKDILYRSKIIGLENNGDIYVIWDCYWFPIQDDKIRKIKIIEL